MIRLHAPHQLCSQYIRSAPPYFGSLNRSIPPHPTYYWATSWSQYQLTQTYGVFSACFARS